LFRDARQLGVVGRWTTASRFGRAVGLASDVLLAMAEKAEPLRIRNGWVVIDVNRVTERLRVRVAGALRGVNRELALGPVTVRASSAAGDLFDRFWERYPRKVGKAAARRAFERALKHVTFDAMMAALERHRRLRQWTQREYIPHPATWLNQHRWADELDEADLLPDVASWQSPS
jgi:hypothetical protein